MDCFTVSFFGHRQPEGGLILEKRLKEIVRELLLPGRYVEFLVGCDGEFDRMVASVVRSCMREVGADHSALCLVLPYSTAKYRDNAESFHSYYDEIEIFASAEKVHFKAAHQKRNRSMVDRSDLVIFHVIRDHGGAYQTLRYAKKVNANYINLSV